MKIYETEPEVTAAAEQPAANRPTPGTISTDGKHYLRVATADGWLRLTALQLPGKKRLGVEELLRGFHPDEQWYFV